MLLPPIIVTTDFPMRFCIEHQVLATAGTCLYLKIISARIKDGEQLGLAFLLLQTGTKKLINYLSLIIYKLMR